jgi:hypothetical protein
MEPNPLAALDDDLWCRLLAATECGSVHMVRTAPARRSLQHCRRTWHIVLCGVTDRAYDWLGSEAPTLNEAVGDVLRHARCDTPSARHEAATVTCHDSQALWARLRRYDPGFRISISRPARPAAGRAAKRPWRMELEDECELLQRRAACEHDFLATAIANALDGAERLRWLGI